MNDARTVAPHDAWYAIGGSSALNSGEVQPVSLFGIERVAWRDEDGESHVWHNRCIHRGMRLQYGFVDGNRLACRYHGWRFDGDGKCAHIPAHPGMTPPDDFCVPASPSAESAGLIWTTTGDPEGPPPDLSEFTNLTFCRSVAVNCHSAVAETLLEQTEFAPFSGGVPETGFSARKISAGIVAVETSSGDALVVAIQPAGETKTHLHILSNAAVANTDIPALRRHFSAWARRFRWQLENRHPDTETA